MATPRRNFLALGAAAVTAVGLAACDASGNTTAGAPTSGPGEIKADGSTYIAIVSKGFQHRFWQAVREGAEKAAKEFNVTISFEGPDTEKDIQPQVEMLTAALNKNPAALAFAALDSKASESVLEQFKQKNIPVVAFDSGVDSDIPVTTCSTDNKGAAAEAAKHLLELIGNKGTVGVVAHDQTSKSGTDRRDGFIEYVKANAPEVKLLDTVYGDGDLAKSADVTKAMISANSDLVAIYGTNEGSAIGVINGVKELNKTGLTIVGFDSGKTQLDAIRDGSEAGAVTQNPVGIGYETVKAAVAAIKGETVEKVIDTGFYWYDKSNIDSDEIKPNLYE